MSSPTTLSPSLSFRVLFIVALNLFKLVYIQDVHSLRDE